MPLKQGSSNEIVGENIKTEMAHGKPQKQAEAIALKEAGKSNQDAIPEAAVPRSTPMPPVSPATQVSGNAGVRSTGTSPSGSTIAADFDQIRAASRSYGDNR